MIFYTVLLLPAFDTSPLSYNLNFQNSQTVIFTSLSCDPIQESLYETRIMRLTRSRKIAGRMMANYLH